MPFQNIVGKGGEYAGNEAFSPFPIIFSILSKKQKLSVMLH